MALTIALSNNAAAPVLEHCDCPVLLETGAEIISGSTRLKAGTAQKIALNTFSSALMVRLNKVYGNLMVDLRPTNAKLVRRSIRLTMPGSAGTWLSGTALRARPMLPLSMGSNQPGNSSTCCGASAAMVALSIDSTSLS